MDVTIGKASILHLTNIPDADPVDVIMINTASNSGRIVISHWASAWTAYYENVEGFLSGHVGKRNIGSLVNEFNSDVDIYEDDIDAIVKQAKTILLKRRKSKLMDDDFARDCYDKLCEFDTPKSVWELDRDNFNLLGLILPEDWAEDVPQKLTKSARTLKYILPFVQSALLEITPNYD